MIRFTLITGPMFAEKTTHLAQEMRRDMDAGKRVALLRPAQDTREKRFISFVQPVLPVSLTTDPFGQETADLLALTRTIGADEVQFIAPWFAGFLDALTKATRLPDVHVIAAGLDLKANARPWPGMAALAERANLHIRHTATCTRCGAPATMTLSTMRHPRGCIRVGDEGYEPVCRHCWEKAHAEKARAGKAAA